MKDIISNIREELSANAYKYTPQRETIMQVMAEHPDQHLSADEVYSLVKQKAPDIGMATVYRTLDLLENLKLIHRMNFGDGKSRFEISQAGVHHHHHLICLSCGEIIEVKKDLLAQLEEIIARENDFSIVDHRLQFYGYCTKCQQNQSDR